MATKYILHGGNAQDVNDQNTAFFREILNGHNQHVNILLVQLAAVPEKQDIYKQRHVAQFERANDSHQLKYQVAEITELHSQLAWADVVYFSGSPGGTVRLLEAIGNDKDLEQNIQEKTVAGESAGANFFSAYCYSRSGGVLKGTGIVPVNLIAHYEVGDERYMNDMDNDFPLVKLRNYEFQVFQY